MLLTFLICILILYAPVPGNALPAPWPLTAGAVGLLAALVFVVGWLGSAVGVLLCARMGRRGLAITARLFSLMKGLVIGFVVADVFLFKWPLLVMEFMGDARWALLVHDVLLLLPAVVMVVTVMAWQYRVERRVGAATLGLGRYLWLRVRMELGIILAPWLLLVLATDLARALFAGTDYQYTADLVATGAVLVGLVVFSPALLRRIWTSSPLPAGPLRERLLEFGRRHNFHFNDVLVWHTHHHVANAGVVGPTPVLRYVMITDSLLQGCDVEEIVGIFAHEVAHVRRRHIPFYMAMAAGFVVLFAVLTDALAALGLMSPLRDLLAFEMTVPQAALMMVFAGVYWVGLFGFISRRMELEADLFALREVEDPAAFVSALEKLGRMSRSPRGRSHWRHFSIARRVRLMRRMQEQPSLARRFLRMLRIWQFGLLGLCALCTAYVAIFRPELFGM